MKIAVIGVGGVGGYIGAKLAAVGSKDLAVCFVARGEHLKAIQERGLTVQSRDFAGGKINVKPWIATDRLGDLWQAEVFIVTVKGYDLAKVALDLKPLVKKETVILPLLNGADIYDRLRRVIPNGIILPGCIYISAHLGAAGTVNHTSTPGRIILGKDPKHPDFVPEALLQVFNKAKLDYVWKENAACDIWEKYIFISAFSLVSACYERTIGEILADPALLEITVGIMKEVFRIALARGIALPEQVVDLA